MNIEKAEESQITLFSETDLYGTITFANEEFCKISKYTLDELLTKPHNVVRHPDMPKEIFSLLWKTIKQGEIFRVVLKNRASDDSHYWVRAIIMPFKDQQNQISKYVSIRHLIKDEEVAVKLYEAQMNYLRL